MIKNSSDQLWNTLIKYGTNAPRGEVIKYVKVLIDEAKAIDLNKLSQKAQRSSATSRGYDVASKLIATIARQEWIDEISESSLSEVLEIATELAMNSQDEELWRELFDKVAELR